MPRTGFLARSIVGKHKTGNRYRAGLADFGKSLRYFMASEREKGTNGYVTPDISHKCRFDSAIFKNHTLHHGP